MASAVNSYVIFLKLCPTKAQRVAVSEIRPDKMTVDCHTDKHMNAGNWLSQLNRRPREPKTGSSVKVKGMNRFRHKSHNMIYFSLTQQYGANRRLVLAGVCHYTVLD